MEPDDSRRRRQMPAPEQSKGQRLIGSFFKPATSADQQRERSAAEARKTAELVMKRTKPEMMV